MRNPLKAYWFAYFHVHKPAKPTSASYRFFTTWIWETPKSAFEFIQSDVAKSNEVTINEVVIVNFTRN